MIKFYSGNARGANSGRVLDMCFDSAFGSTVPDDIRLVVVYATLGHKLDKVNELIHERLPGVPVVGSTCGGVVGPNGVGESMNELGIFAVGGSADEVGYAAVSDVTADNSRAKAAEMARALKDSLPGVNATFVVTPGINSAIDEVTHGYESVLGDVPMFGGVASDNMKSIATYQLHDDLVDPQGMWLVGFADPTLATVNRATHGFLVIGEPLTVTASDGVRILEFDGVNAWEAYATRFKLTEEAGVNEIMPFGAVAEELPEDCWEEYGSKYLLHGMMGKDDEGAMVYRATFKPGTVLRLAIRDEALIFSEMRRILDEMRAQADGEFEAVLQSDCIARGRFSLDAISKDELISMMQDTLAHDDGSKAAWLGMYGFGEFVPIRGKNQYHTYTTSLMAFYRKKQA